MRGGTYSHRFCVNNMIQNEDKQKENLNLSLHVTLHNASYESKSMRTLCFGRPQLRIFHMFNLPGEKEERKKAQESNLLHKFFRSSENLHGKIFNEQRTLKRVCSLHDSSERERTLKRKYFMLFKCVLYYILTAINFIRLFIRAVLHRGLKGE